MQLVPWVVLWVLLASVVGILALYRLRIAGHSDELLHVDDAEASQIPAQQVVASRLEVIDRWGKILTVVVMLYGLGLAGAYILQVWRQTSAVSM